MEVKKPHIQLPKQILKSFSHKTRDGRKVYYLDLNKNVISEEKINVLGTAEVGFYSEAIESLLSEKENFFGLRANELKDFWKAKTKTLTLSVDMQKDIFRFFDMLYVRSKDFTRLYNQNSQVSMFLGNIARADVVAAYYSGRAPGVFEDVISSTHRISLLINKTNSNFVVPMNGYYFCSNDAVLPISPKITIILIQKDDERLKDADYGIITSEKTINTLNKCAYKTEKEMNDDFIVAQRDYDLLGIAADYNR